MCLHGLVDVCRAQEKDRAGALKGSKNTCDSESRDVPPSESPKSKSVAITVEANENTHAPISDGSHTPVGGTSPLVEARPSGEHEEDPRTLSIDFEIPNARAVTGPKITVGVAAIVASDALAMNDSISSPPLPASDSKTPMIASPGGVAASEVVPILRKEGDAGTGDAGAPLPSTSFVPTLLPVVGVIYILSFAFWR